MVCVLVYSLILVWLRIQVNFKVPEVGGCVRCAKYHSHITNLQCIKFLSHKFYTKFEREQITLLVCLHWEGVLNYTNFDKEIFYFLCEDPRGSDWLLSQQGRL